MAKVGLHGPGKGGQDPSPMLRTRPKRGICAGFDAIAEKNLGRDKGGQSVFRKTITAAVLAVGALTISAGPALAGDTAPNGLPAPGVLGLVAIGVIGAIALARSRK